MPIRPPYAAPIGLPPLHIPEQTFTGRLIVRLDPEVVREMESSFAPRKELSLREVGERFSRSGLLELLGELGDPPTARLMHRWSLGETRVREERVAPPGINRQRSLNSYFSVDLRGRTLPYLIGAAARFRRLGDVDAAFVEPTVRPASPVTPDDRTYRVGPYRGQGYVFGDHTEDSEKSGINAAAVWGLYDGSGVRFVDLESGWKVTHPELPQPGGNPLQLLDAVMVNVGTWRDHGTRAVGIVAAKDDPGKGAGIVGIAPGVDAAGLASYEYSTSGAWEIVDAIAAVIDTIGAGDVLLIEVHTQGTTVGTVMLPKGYPIEIVDPWLDAIRLAVLHGITVVEPAGNPQSGSSPYDLDTATWTPIGSSPRSLDPTDPTFIDSGAIMVGECKSVPVADDLHERPSYAWYGKRIDCYAWGEDVLTTACYGIDYSTGVTTDTCPDSSAGEARYDYWGGTSAASAIIAGACALIHEMYEKSLNVKASPLQVRGIVRDLALGTPIGNIGSTMRSMPDLGKVAASLVALPDIYVRDSLADVGAVPAAVVSMSPDIFVLNAPLDPVNPGSPYDDPTKFVPNDLVVPDADNYVYVRISNLSSAAPAIGCDAILYWTPPSTLLLPSDWRQIGWLPATVNVAPGGQTIAGPVVWHPAVADLPHGGHGCFIAQLHHPRDPRPIDAPDVVTWDEFLALIGRSNNVAWKNFNAIPSPPAMAEPPHPGDPWSGLDFDMRGVPGEPMEFDFVIVPRNLPEATRIYWRMPLDARELLGNVDLPDIDAADAPGTRFVLTLRPDRRLRLSQLGLPANARIPMSFGVFPPGDLDPDSGASLEIRQYYRGFEVGRITWSWNGQRRH